MHVTRLKVECCLTPQLNKGSIASLARFAWNLKSAYNHNQSIASNLTIYNKYICCRHLIFLLIKPEQLGLMVGRTQSCRQLKGKPSMSVRGRILILREPTPLGELRDGVMEAYQMLCHPVGILCQNVVYPAVEEGKLRTRYRVCD